MLLGSKHHATTSSGGGVSMSNDEAVFRHNYVHTEGGLTGPTTYATWNVFHQDNFWDAWYSCEK